MNKHRAFTLLETLIVLSVLSLFASVSFVAIPKIQEELEVYYFLNQFENNILLTQQAAIFSVVRTTIKKEYQQNYIEFLLEGNRKVTQTAPPALNFKVFPPVYFGIGTGNIVKTETIIFSWENKKQEIKYEFLFGKGRYEKTIKQIN